MDGKALERIQKCLADCTHPRGVCGTTITIDVSDDPDNPDLRKATRAPAITLLADDIVAVCDQVPEAKRDKIVKALRKGSLPHTIERRLRLGPVDELGEPLDETTLAPAEVHILVDHAWHLAETAAGQPRSP